MKKIVSYNFFKNDKGDFCIQHKIEHLIPELLNLLILKLVNLVQPDEDMNVSFCNVCEKTAMKMRVNTCRPKLQKPFSEN